MDFSRVMAKVFNNSFQNQPNTKQLDWYILLPATSCGLFAVAVLNVNNIRDIESDTITGKRSIPVRLGRKKAETYHWILLITGMLSSIVYFLMSNPSFVQALFLFSYPLFIINGIAILTKRTAKELDPYLKQMALSTLLFVLLFGIGLILK